MRWLLRFGTAVVTAVILNGVTGAGAQNPDNQRGEFPACYEVEAHRLDEEGLTLYIDHPLDYCFFFGNDSAFVRVTADGAQHRQLRGDLMWGAYAYQVDHDGFSKEGLCEGLRLIVTQRVSFISGDRWVILRDCSGSPFSIQCSPFDPFGSQTGVLTPNGEICGRNPDSPLWGLPSGAGLSQGSAFSPFDRPPPCSPEDGRPECPTERK